MKQFRLVVLVSLLMMFVGLGLADEENLPELLPEIGRTKPLPPESRQFDFWLGEWEVLLRTRQEDGSWDESTRSRAKIYPVLKKKAVLELWDSEKIKGYSLRYFDIEKGKWVLWLNWPGPNRSGGSGLEGTFRHGRGEFFSTSVKPDGTEVISRYTFSDISASSLRWDDAFSEDGGLTWSQNWIMEFTRAAPTPELPLEGGPLHTFDTGKRCDLDEFRKFEALGGRHSGEVRVRSGEDSWIESRAELWGYRILDGCGILSLLRYGDRSGSVEILQLHTWNTHAKVFEESWLDSDPSTPLEVYYGGEEEGVVDLILSDKNGAEPRVRRHIWQITEKTAALEILQAGDSEDSWITIVEVEFPLREPPLPDATEFESADPAGEETIPGDSR